MLVMPPVFRQEAAFVVYVAIRSLFVIIQTKGGFEGETVRGQWEEPLFHSRLLCLGGIRPYTESH